VTDYQEIRLKSDRADERLDHFLARLLPGLSRSQVQRLIKAGLVALERGRSKPSLVLGIGELIVVHIPESEPELVQPEAIPLEIIFEDKALVVINKPPGLIVHPGRGHPDGTLVNALVHRYPELATQVSLRPGIVHRLDQGTSGLMVVGRTQAAWSQLKQQFKERQVEKTYLALVHGVPTSRVGLIDVPIGRHPHQRLLMAPVPTGKSARTRFTLKETVSEYSLLVVRLETGRTHQIRVHLSWLGYPIVGDSLYGRRRNALGAERQMLHAWRLSLAHPLTGQPLSFEAPLPADFQQILDGLRQAASHPSTS
jgi:23S rRNA pseudouridine1911/1915/1917 synthase